jgi:phage baseplate assembly protein W
MAQTYDFRDFYIRYKGHPMYKEGVLVQDDVIHVIIQKYEMILFTNQGELLGDPNFGCNLEELLYETRVDSKIVENQIRAQISQYIPELDSMNYNLNVVFAQDVENYQEMMYVYFELADYEVFAQIGTQYGGF